MCCYRLFFFFNVFCCILAKVNGVDYNKNHDLLVLSADWIIYLPNDIMRLLLNVSMKYFNKINISI